jgi:polysaccharide biosynthesis transport protein
MAHDEIPLARDPNGSSSMALLPAGVIDHPPVDWTATGPLQPAEQGGIDLFTYIHALRRHWLMAFGIALVCAAAAGPAVWYSIGDKYTAKAFLRVAMQEKPIAFTTTDIQATMDRDRFEIYKSTQQQMVLSRWVLTRALGKTDVLKLESVQKTQKETDIVWWLTQYLSVNFPGKAEIMEICVTRPHAKEAATLVQAVVAAYMAEVVDNEAGLKRKRLSELDSVYAEKDREIRGKRDDLKKLAETLGASDTDALTTRQKLQLDMLNLYRQELARTQFDMRRLQSEQAAQQALLKTIESSELGDADLEAAVQSDPIAKQLFVELGWKKLDQTYMEGAMVSGSRSHYSERYMQEINNMQRQYDARRAELADVVRLKKKSTIMLDAQRIQATLAVLSEQEQTQQREVDEKQRDAERFGSSTVDIEMLRAEIKNLDTLLTTIAAEREKLKVEVKATPRITPLGDKPEIPDVPSNGTIRLALTFLATMFAFACPIAIVILWDARAKRINSATDVAQRLRLPVLGWMPLIPPRIIRRLGSPSKRSQTWHMRLTESVDGIAARVLRKADTEQCRVIMVSSAAGGEGKTTLATQLAMSLARAGRQTVLVDFDLRRPAFDEVFGLPLEPGVCEALRQQDSVSAIVHQVVAENLAVLTAGRWDRTALATLSNGAAAAMFKQLREDYDFVVVDTSPILPVADARFVSQHVDSVVLSVFRDISEVPKIEAACEILAAFGANNVEAVVTGPNENMYGRHMGYETTIPA